MLYVCYTSIKLDKSFRGKKALNVFHKYTIKNTFKNFVFHKIDHWWLFMNNIWWVLNPSGVDLKSKC